MTFRKGDPAINRKGRPVGTAGVKYGGLRRLALKLAEEVVTVKRRINGELVEEKIPAIEAILRANRENAITGDPIATKWFCETAYGRDPEKHEITGPNGKVIQVEHRGITEEQARALEDVILGRK